LLQQSQKLQVLLALITALTQAGHRVLLFSQKYANVPGAPFDIRTVHAGEAVAESSPVDKWIAQLWLCEGNYTPSAPVGNAHIVDTIHQFCLESGHRKPSMQK